MANLKISQLSAGNPALAGDLIPIDRAGSNFSITAGSIVALTTWASLIGDLTETQVIPWDGSTIGTPDTGISRISAGILAVGNGIAGDISGTIEATKFLGVGNQLDTGRLVLGTDLGVFAKASIYCSENIPLPTGDPQTFALYVNYSPQLPMPGQLTGLYVATASNTTSQADASINGMVCEAVKTGTGTINLVTGLAVVAENQGNGNIGVMTGVNVDLGAAGAGITAVIGQLIGYACTYGFDSGSVTELMGFYYSGPQFGTSTVGTQYAVYLSDVTGATTNYAIYTGLGKVHFGDVVDWGSDVGISRIGAGALAIGNGTAGDESGTLYVTTIHAPVSNVLSFQAGEYIFNSGIAVFEGGIENIGGLTQVGAIDLNPMGTATSVSGNYPSNQIVFIGSYWTGSAAASDEWTLASILGTGSTPSSNFALSHGTATLGAQVFSVPSGMAIGWSSNAANDGVAPDTGISRISAGTLGVGTGAAGSVAGTLNAATLIMNASSSPTSTSGGGTAGTAGQLAWDGSFLYLCTVTGAAGSATWTKITLLADV